MNGKKWILLAEDDITMRSLLMTLLDIEGFSVMAFDESDTQDLLSVLRDEKPSALILDVHLGKTNGIEIVHQIRSDETIGSLPVLMTSGMALHDECMAAGATGFLMKPYMPNELVKWLKLHMNSQ